MINLIVSQILTLPVVIESLNGSMGFEEHSGAVIAESTREWVVLCIPKR